MTELIIIGAGPYGLSLAAHAEAEGLSYVLLGLPMHFWKEQMPQSMFIRTNPQFVSLSDPRELFTIQKFSEATNIPLSSPLPRPVFVDYAFWFAQQTAISITCELAADVSYNGEQYKVTGESGKEWYSEHVIIATGLQHFSFIPAPLSSLPDSRISHTYGKTDFSAYKGHKTAVIGSGQSAWEAAALLHLAGSDVELIFRSNAPNYSEEDNLISGQKLIDSAKQFYLYSDHQKQDIWKRPRKSSVAYFLKPFVEGKITMFPASQIVRTDILDNQAVLSFSNGNERSYDQIIAATGYQINVEKLPFLSPNLLHLVEKDPFTHRFPILNERFESNVPGLFFAGPLASHSHGPAFGFVAGIRAACTSIISYLSEKTKYRSERL